MQLTASSEGDWSGDSFKEFQVGGVSYVLPTFSVEPSNDHKVGLQILVVRFFFADPSRFSTSVERNVLGV